MGGTLRFLRRKECERARMWGVGLRELVGKGAREWGGLCLGCWAEVH